MAKRYTDTSIWKNQRWFRKLSPIYKLAWKYIADTCDHAGILKIDYSEFIEDLGVDKFDINDFISNCNTDFDKKDGKKYVRSRIELVAPGVFWLTGFIKFQYENKSMTINPLVPMIYTALEKLEAYGCLERGINKGYLTLTQPYRKGMLRAKEKDKVKNSISNSVIVSNSENGKEKNGFVNFRAQGEELFAKRFAQHERELADLAKKDSESENGG